MIEETASPLWRQVTSN